MINEILKYADEFDMLPESGAVVVCVSGGADSMCLLDIMREISKERALAVCAAHYNHRLRGDESDRDEAFVRERCDALGVPLHVGVGDVRVYAKAHGLGIEEAARDMRYGFFRSVADATGARQIATAHTADDNAETVIMTLVRGAGAAGLSGIPPKRGMIIRPMLAVPRDDVMRYVAERGIPFVEDSTNNLDIYTRNKIRHSVMPVLKSINPRFVEAAAAAAALSRADESYLSEMADRFIAERCKQGDVPNVPDPDAPLVQDDVIPVCRNICILVDSATSRRMTGDWQSLSPVILREVAESRKEENVSAHWCILPSQIPCGLYRYPISVDAKTLASLPFAISSRVVRKLCGGKLSHKHVAAVLALCNHGNRWQNGTHTVFREYERVVFDRERKPEPKPEPKPAPGSEPAASAASPLATHNTKPATFEPVEVENGCCATIPELGLKITCNLAPCGDRINKSFTSFLFKSDGICGKIKVRPRREGDTIRLLGRNGAKTLKKLFIERRIPARQRPLIPVIADDIGVLAIYGIGPAERAAPAPGDLALRVEFESLNPKS